MDVEPQIQRECIVEGAVQQEGPICYTWRVNYAEDGGPEPLHCSGINCTVQMSVLSKLTNQSNPSRSVFIGTGKLSKIYTEIDAQNRFEKDRRLILRFTTKLL